MWVCFCVNPRAPFDSMLITERCNISNPHEIRRKSYFKIVYCGMGKNEERRCDAFDDDTRLTFFQIATQVINSLRTNRTRTVPWNDSTEFQRKRRLWRLYLHIIIQLYIAYPLHASKRLGPLRRWGFPTKSSPRCWIIYANPRRPTLVYW